MGNDCASIGSYHEKARRLWKIAKSRLSKEGVESVFERLRIQYVSPEKP
jgi:hypothetical protein